MMTEQKLNELYERFGYRKFKMTKFEPYDLYADNRDFLKSSQLITFTDLDGSLLALKPDVTLSIIKSNLGGEEKVYYNETVYRPKDSHYREILQSGIECIGRIDAYSEAEVIALAAESLKLIGERFVIRVSDAAFLQEMFATMGLTDSTIAEALRLFSMKNTAGFDARGEAHGGECADAEIARGSVPAVPGGGRRASLLCDFQCFRPDGRSPRAAL